MSQYPYVLIPEVLQNLQVQQWEKLKEPSVPIEPIPPKPLLKPKRINFLELLIFFLIGSIFSFLLGMVNSVLLVCGIVVTFLSIIIHFFQNLRAFNQKISQYSKISFTLFGIRNTRN